MKRDAASDPKAAVRAYFDRDVCGYLGAYSPGAGEARGEIFRERRRLVLALIREPVGRVLDVGAGPGVFTPALLERRGECFVVDLSLEMVSAGRDQIAVHPHARRVHHEAADVEALPFRGGAFDTALCVGVLQYLAGPDAALAELARVVRPGGQVIVTFPNRRSPLNMLHRAVASTLRVGRAGLQRIGVRLTPLESRLTFRTDIPNASFTPAQINEKARPAGLRLDCLVCHSVHFPFSVPGIRPIFRMWDRAANTVFRASGLRIWGREFIARFVRDG